MIKRPEFLTIPCGRTLAYNENCVEGHLCTHCEYISRLETHVKELLEVLSIVNAKLGKMEEIQKLNKLTTTFLRTVK